MMKRFARCLLWLVVLSLLLSSGLIYLTLRQGESVSRSLFSQHGSFLGQVFEGIQAADTADSNYKDMVHEGDGQAVHTSQCFIPDVELYHSSVSKYLRRDTPSLRCDRTKHKPDLTFVKGDLLVVNDTSIASYGSLDYCEFVEIIRPEHSDSSYELGKKRFKFKDRAVIKKPFIKVYCYSSNNSLIYQNLHATTPTKNYLKHLKENLLIRHKRMGYLERLNVLMVGLDSVSRLNFYRQFPKTLSVLKERLSAYELYGYNKVRDNTFINLVPMFLGKYVEETDWNETSNTGFDKHEYAWKTYGKAGYHTLFAEDAPKIAIWNYEKKGFSQPPADYYLRPFSLAMAATKKMWHNDFHCFGDRLETDITLDYVSKFIETRQNAPYFAFTFLTRPTYENLNQNTDASHSAFLNSLIDHGLLENTMVIYFSDHGARHSDILSTYIGKLEERLPAMFISLPSWFIRKYPQTAQNLQVNQRRLTTPFDIHELLRDVLRFKGQPKIHSKAESRAYSLFDRVPENRSCKTATIDDHWCTCLEQKSVSVNSAPVKKAAELIITSINNMTRAHRDKCVELKLEKITEALQSSPQDKLLTFKMSVNDVIGRKVYYGDEALGRVIIYHVIIKVSPSGAVYHGTVRYEAASNSYHLSGDISNSSTYGDSSWCISLHSLKKFCYCDVQRSR
ncbi:uncharacterized protein [Watersipora subatra]|uniref:uncharacterized protein n=1 Tax=Watersipora subatra TaxID=2589382 RepID=UPI00355B4361